MFDLKLYEDIIYSISHLQINCPSIITLDELTRKENSLCEKEGISR